MLRFVNSEAHSVNGIFIRSETESFQESVVTSEVTLDKVIKL